MVAVNEERVKSGVCRKACEVDGLGRFTFPPLVETMATVLVRRETREEDETGA